MITFIYTNKNDNAFINLCKQLNLELEASLTGKINPITSRKNKTDDFSNVILAVENNNYIGCIALRPFCKDCAEVKRMFVLPSKRHLGIGKQLLEKCIELSIQQGYTSLVLETNTKLPIAQKLYSSLGFYKISSYGPYASLEETLCMKKDL